MTKSELILYVTLTVSALAGGYICFDKVSKDYELYLSESKCVHDKLMANYSRKDILTGDGTCWIRNEDTHVDFKFNR